MKRPTWLRKALWILPLSLVILLVVGGLGARAYLSSDRASRLVADRLQTMLGGTVEVGSAHIGLVGDSSVQGIRAFADGDEGGPWLQIDDVKADLSALSALRDRSPEDIRLRGAKVALRFSSSGHLLTQLPTRKKAAPTELPRLHIEQGELTLNQEGQPPMVIHGINVDIVPGSGGVTLTGTVNDDFWGDWNAHGVADTAAGKTSLTLHSDGVDVTMEKLRSIAFVPPKVWQQVHVEGHTPATVQLDVQTGGDQPKVHYRVEIEPRDAHVQVPSIDLDATQAHGRAVVADQLVKLDDVHGKTAGGDISTSGDLNFRDEPTRLTFKVGVCDVVLHDLPRSWKVPPKIDGLLTGSADLVVTIAQGKVTTAGSGEGEIRNAKWSGFQINRPIRLALHSDGKRFRFHQPKPVTLTQRYPPDARAAADEPAPEGPKPVAVEESDEEGAEAGGFLESAPGRIVGLMGRGVGWGTDQLSRGIDAAARGLGKLKPPSKPGEQPTYLDVDLNLQNVDLGQLVQKLKLTLPVELAGRLTIAVHASIPINTPGDTKAYRLRGDAKMPTLRVAGLEMADVEAKARYADGVLDLEELRGKMPRPKDPKTAGTFEGGAHVEVVPQGDLRVRLKLANIPLQSALSMLPAAGGERVSGAVSGDLDAHAPMATLGDPATWRGTANLTSPLAEVYGLPVREASVAVKVAEGQATLSTFKADVAGTPLKGEGALEFKGAYPFKAGAHLGRTDLSSLNQLSPSFRPPVEIKGRAKLNGSVTGTLKPFKLDTSGEVEAHQLLAEGFRVDDLSFRWSRSDEGVKLDAIKAKLYGGEVTGSAVVPTAASSAGTAKLRLRDLDVQTLAKSLPSFPVRLEGKVSGTVNGKLSPAAADRPRAWTTDIELTAPKLRVQGVPTEKLKGTIDSRGGKTSYRLEGESLGGTFTLKGDLPPEASRKEAPEESDGPGLLQARFQPPAAPAGGGRLEVRGARLSRLWEAYNITGGLSHLRGRFFIDLPYRHTGPNFFPVGNGTFRIVNVRWDDETLGDSLQGDVRLTPNEFQLFNVTGDVAGGLFMGRFVFGLKANSRSWFDFEVQQAEASRLLVPLPAVAPHVKGPVDLNLRGRIGPEWDGGGGATLTRGQVYGLDVTEWRIPMQFSFSPAQETGELTVRDSSARIAQGRARFESTLNWGNGLRLRGLLLFYQVDLRTLLRHSPEVASYASGRVSGRVDLSGDEMRSANDLRAVVQARLEQGQALQMPVLRQITPYLRPGVSSATFQSGNLKGRLANGIFNVEQMTLVGDLLQLFIQGTVNLAGNLNLEVTAQTGLYCLNPARNNNNLDSRIPLIGAIPRLILYEASSLIANRVVHLRVTGTVRNPTVRLEPLVILTEEAVRFFLGRLLVPSIPAVP